MSFSSIMKKRISNGLSKVQSDRASYNLLTADYFFCNKTCTVYICATDSFIELDPEIYKELINSYWTEVRNDLHHSKHTISYNREISSDDGSDSFLDLQEDENSPVPENEFFIHELKSKYDDIVDTLCPIQAQIIRGIYFQQRTEAEMSKLLGKTQANIHYHKVRALKALKKIMERIEPEELEL